MPVTVEHTVKAKSVRIGDEIQFPGKHFTELVDDVDPKVKWTTISTDYGPTKIELDTEVTVYRQELTEEEAKAEEHRRALAWITSRIEEAPEIVEVLKAKLLSDLDTKSVGWHASSWANFAAAQVAAAIWERVAKVAENHKVDLVEAVRLVEADIKKRIVRDLSPLHNSTSAVSTLANAVELQVTVEWVRELEWHVF